VWTRDGIDWALKTGLTAAQVKASPHDMIPADVASYRAKDGDRYAVLWRNPGKGESAVLCVGVPAEKLATHTATVQQDGYLPATVQGMTGGDGIVRFAVVWRKSAGKPVAVPLLHEGDQPTHADMTFAGERLLSDVHVGGATEGPPQRVRLAADLERARQAVRENPNDVNGYFAQGVALYHLGRDDEATKAFADYLSRSEAYWGHRYRALIHARAGRARQARRDLAVFASVSTDRALLARVTALVGVYLGDATAALKTLDAAVAANPSDGELAFQAACVYAQAARVSEARQLAWTAGLIAAPGVWARLAVPPRSGEGLRCAQRSLVLVEQAVAKGYRNFTALQSEPDLEPIRRLGGYRDLVARHGMQRRYASVWQEDATREAMGLSGLSAEAHLARCRELAARGYRPAALSLAVLAGEKGPLAASVWHRPVPPVVDQERLASRQGTAAATLLHLKQPEQVWPLLRHSPDPTVRSYLVERVGSRGVDPILLARRLAVEKDVSARRALIVALGDYTEKDLPAAVRGLLVKKLLGWYRDDSDPGIHGAIDWLLRHGKEGPVDRRLDWGQAKELARIDKELAGKPPLAPPLGFGEGAWGRGRWYVNGQGQTFSVIRGPVQFRMGSPLWEPDRVPITEKPHRREIPRSFAIATKPVTVAQWQQFLKERPDVPGDFLVRYSPEEDGPIIQVSWFMAAQYCNWLSEKEGIPKKQWCYPDDIKEGMKPFPDYLQRTGYRLPSEAEWEYACRAESGSSRYYGSSLDLLPRYAIFQGNSQDRTWPVGQKRPNDLGLFDMHGNVWTWCQESAWGYPTGTQSRPVPDREDLRPVTVDISRVLRDASFYNRAPLVRSAFRSYNRPAFRSYIVGVRACRTYP
jgi:formylglycine-generating enzyme required for sulfatase activity/tetratricopeptide (TPR) repeat protein